MEILVQIWRILVCVGLVFVFGLMFFIIVGIIGSVKQTKREMKLRKKILTDPSFGFKEIIELETLIAEEDIVHKEKMEAKMERLTQLKDNFNRRFPYTSVDQFRKFHDKNYPINGEKTMLQA